MSTTDKDDAGTITVTLTREDFDFLKELVEERVQNLTVSVKLAKESIYKASFAYAVVVEAERNIGRIRRFLQVFAGEVKD